MTKADDIEAMPRRTSEKVVSAFFRIATRATTLRPSMIPSHMRRELQMIGIEDADLAKVLAGVRHFRDWPYAWEAEGDRKRAAGDAFGAAAAYYIAQKLLLTDSPLKRRLYKLVLDQYPNANTQFPSERIVVSADDETVVAIVQFPTNVTTDRPVPLVVLVPGVTAAKEEFHPVAEPFIRRGIAVARMDNPGYGETTGVLRDGSEYYPALIIEELAKDPRIDASRVHLLGFSLGGFFAMHSARVANVASVVTVSAPYDPAVYLSKLPSMILTALGHMTGSISFDELYAASENLSLARVAPLVTVPVKVFHGARDRTIPHYEAFNIVGAVASSSSLTIFPKAHHNCLEPFEEMAAEILTWIEDPYAVIAADAVSNRSPEQLAEIFDAQGKPESAPQTVGYPSPEDGLAELG